jgi:hypothetical protein
MDLTARGSFDLDGADAGGGGKGIRYNIINGSERPGAESDREMPGSFRLSARRSIVVRFVPPLSSKLNIHSPL